MTREMRKARLIETVRQNLLESVEAEKSAVLATTDEESQALALQARTFETEINILRGDLRQLIVADGRRGEIEKLDAFDVAWAELEQVDERLLALAVANTNLKAIRLLSRDGAAALDRCVNALTETQRVLSDPEIVRTLSHASVAALRSQSLLFVHISSADAAEMTRLEQQMHDLGNEVERCLRSARESGQVGSEQLAAASHAWGDYQRLAADVVRLSRENSNVISTDVSVHEKRQATKACLAALAALSAAVDAGPHPSR
ncbi:MAG TPA: MCP four helix bundle domain-containing protein [Burkholderiales bacterium]|nr:MCP four helix bundle domain-containing protein [Burkholderiales bacterium]